MRKTKLNTELVRKTLDYDQSSGDFIWLYRDESFVTNGLMTDRDRKAFNTKRVGKKAGCVNSTTGYLTTKFLQEQWDLHRLAFLWMGEELPEQVDHKNGIRDDNSWLNLRPVTNHENRKNMKKPKNNTSGHIGVYRNKKRGVWAANIMINKKCIYLGSFETIEEAVVAHKKAAEEAGFYPGHGREGIDYND